MLDRRRHYQLDFDGLVFVLQTLTRGEIFRCYLDLGFPEREIPEGNPGDQARLESALFRIACLEKPEGFITDTLPAGVVTQAARFALEKSGFLEKTPDQEEILREAMVYSKSSEARGDALIMHTFPKYSLDDLHALEPREWTRLVFLAVTVQAEIYGVRSKEFLLSEAVTPEPASPQAPPHGLPEEFINKVFGLTSDRRAGFESTPIVAGGGSLTPNGLQTWGNPH